METGLTIPDANPQANSPLRGAANLFFDDKRSILDCQTQLQTVLPADDTKSVVTDVKSTKSSDYVMDKNDDYCSVCNDMGELLLCDSCTSSFHLTCIGLDGLPAHSDLWLCCACACQICHQGQPSSLTKEGDSKDNDLIKCAQCAFAPPNRLRALVAEDRRWDIKLFPNNRSRKGTRIKLYLSGGMMLKIRSKKHSVLDNGIQNQSFATLLSSSYFRSTHDRPINRSRRSTKLFENCNTSISF
nr:increased DNA methylation 1-like [Tanacetum cinerariifolium]